jgi:chloride channel, nucleotide-sensitive, 1A
MEILHETPLESSFILLSQHQSQTPESFYSGPPVLHYGKATARVVITREEATRSPAIEKIFVTNEVSSSDTSADTLVIKDVDIWVSSE